MTLETVPPAVEVIVDGQPRGLTPTTLELTAGPHTVILRRGTDERTVPVDITPGTTVIHRIELAVAVAAGPSTTGRLSIVTEPPGASVSIDGSVRGKSPLTIADVAPGRHRVSVESAGGSAERLVTTEAGATTSVVFSLARTPVLDAGWLTIAAPFEVNVIDGGEVVGTSASTRIMLPAGSRDLDLVSTAVGFQSRRRVDIEAGRTTTIRLDARAALNLNARPWADVTVDGTAVGTTPIANLQVTLGAHEVTFRHPELGERREKVVVTQQGPNRLAVDLSR